MGTRSITTVVDKKGNELVNIYGQFDGYEDGHGQDLLEFLTKGKVINGITPGKNENDFNGIECLAAQLVCHFKKGIGGYYLIPSNYPYSVDYRYKISIGEDAKVINLSVYEFDEEIFEGPISEYNPLRNS